VEQLADEFLTATTQFGTEEDFKYYHHILRHHIPPCIRSLPVDIHWCSGAAIEHVNQQIKKLL
jgi:hypothetical protein